VTVWALVPARGGSKSIPLKNLVPLAGTPLLEYGVRAATAAGGISRIICSTDDDRIATHAAGLGIEVDRRPAHLALDETPVADVAVELLARCGAPDLLLLIQPTSPFLLPEHVAALIAAMQGDPQARSGQTIARCPHNHHAWNQRELDAPYVRFKFADERRRAYNKQSKPPLFVFGNLIAVRPAALMAGDGFFAEPSVAVEVQPPFDFDLDTQADLAVAEALIASGAVRLAHMNLPLESQR
jgi:CMP-N,N'-diacetyllegionaminic acid synthase